MTFLQNNFAKYRWWLLVAAGVMGVLSGDQVLKSLPPGTDLVGALIALYAMARNEREAGSTAAAVKVAERLGAQLQQFAEVPAKLEELRTIAANHADRIDALQEWEKPRGFAVLTALRPVRPALK